MLFFFVQAEDGIRDLVRSRGLGDVYKRQQQSSRKRCSSSTGSRRKFTTGRTRSTTFLPSAMACLLYTSDAADERSSVDLGGRRIINKKKLV